MFSHRLLYEYVEFILHVLTPKEPLELSPQSTVPNLHLELKQKTEELARKDAELKRISNEHKKCVENESENESLLQNKMENLQIALKSSLEKQYVQDLEAVKSEFKQKLELVQNELAVQIAKKLSKSPWEIDATTLKFSKEIGSGGFGKVYEGTWAGSKVAIKKLHETPLSPTTRKSFLHEVKLMISLRHLNIVQYLGACTTSGNECIVMEYLPRGSLEKLLHKDRVHLKTGQIIKYAQDIAAGKNRRSSSNLTL